jgi:peptide/nickel transport system substrate-binding protein
VSTTLNVAIIGDVQGMSITGDPTTAGGWQTINEIHTEGLITSDVNSRKPVGRLADRVPSFDDNSIQLLPDGRMRVTYALRKGVTWQDGQPFTASDMQFAYEMSRDPAIPAVSRDAYTQMDVVDAVDEATLAITFKAPYYLGATLGPRLFWPMPQHLLAEPFAAYQASKNVEEFLHNPYWTTGYVNTGPFRVTTFEPGSGITFQAYDGYFLGRPKLDVIRLQTFGDQNALFASLLAGATDMVVDSAISSADLGFQLKDRWDGSGQGTVNVVRGTTWFLTPQWRPAVQAEAANLDVRVRQALYYALDREALADGLLAGHRELTAWSLLPEEDANFAATKDSLRPFGYDPARARATLQAAGWSSAPDGSVHSAVDGRDLHTSIWTVSGRDKEIAAFAAYWRQIGLAVDEVTLTAAQTRDSQYRASYTGWESTAQGSGDAVFAKFEGPPASAENRWSGNRGGYDDPLGQGFVTTYRRSIRPDDQLAAVKALSDYEVSQLPLLVLYFTPRFLGARKGVKAFDDVAGGSEASVPYGTYTRNAHLWDVE